MKKLLMSFILLGSFSLEIYAEEKVFSLRLLGRYTSQQLFRGAVLWPEPTALAGPMLVFFNKLYLAGPNVYYSPSRRGDQWNWRGGINFIDDDDPPIALTDHEEDYRNRRKSTLESYFQLSYNFGFMNKFQVGALVVREFKENNGLHGEFFGAVPLLPYTSLRARVGFSEKAMAQYIYGPESISGAGYASLGINGVIPHVPWEGIIMLNLTRHWVLQGINKNADFIRGDDQNDVFSFNIFWNAF